jgi:glycosyltransferase involved in cell wall biosynthesis
MSVVRNAVFGGTEVSAKESARTLSETENRPDPIVCVSDLFWDEHWSSEQQLMSRLADRCRVLYVERPVSLLSFLTGSSDASVGRQFWRSLRGRLRHESATLTILTPPPILPLRYFSPVNRLNEWVRLRSIRRALKQLNARIPVLWIYAPDAGRIVGKLKEFFSLYYCADDWAASHQWWNRAADIRAREGELASKVNLIVGTSSKIAKKWGTSYGKSLFISNGADVASFKRARDMDLEIPLDLDHIPHPRVGYVGFVDIRFDAKLYETLARARPEWNFVIVGPLMEKHVDLSCLKPMANVHFLGARPRQQLPAYLKGFDVCTIPYICDTWSESIFPLKLFEYLAAGRPVIATALPELKPFGDYVRIASTNDEFQNAILSSLSNPLPKVSDAFLVENSWDAKADYLWTIISLHLARPQALRLLVTDAVQAGVLQ